VRSTSKKDTHLCVWAAGCECNYGGILKATSCGSKELLLIGRCPKYNKTAISLSFFEVGERSEVGALEKLHPSLLCITSKTPNFIKKIKKLGYYLQEQKKSSTFVADFGYICVCVHTREKNKQKYNKNLKYHAKTKSVFCAAL
jgi:hypothetical protein